jgi:hypothetical protein
MSDLHWTHQKIIGRLEEAAGTLRRLPNDRLQGLKSNWPETIPTWGDYGSDEIRLRLGPPSPEAIDRMDETLEWLRWLDTEGRQMVWLRAERIPWKIIMRKFGRSRSTVTARWKEALSQLVAILNLPTKMSGHLSTGHQCQNLR